MNRMKKNKSNFAMNRRIAMELWTPISLGALKILRQLTNDHHVSVPAGDVMLLAGKWYVTHSGLLRLARRNHCASIDVKPVQIFCDPIAHRWTFEAKVFKSKACLGFVGYGDADPSNVSSLVRGAEMRVAETRAVNRALRKAYGIGICSVEELGSFSRGADSDGQPRKVPPQSSNGGAPNGTGNPRVRDRLCQLIRHHQLDPDLVKAYAIDFCSAKTLKDASRAQIETFVDHLADWAAKDRDALLCQLNSYPREKGEAGEKAGAA